MEIYTLVIAGKNKTFKNLMEVMKEIEKIGCDKYKIIFEDFCDDGYADTCAKKIILVDSE